MDLRQLRPQLLIPLAILLPSLTQAQTIIDSAVAPDFGTLNVASDITFTGDLIVGQNNTGTINQSAGDLDVTGNVILAQNPGATGTINHTGGTFTALGDLAEPASGGASTVNVDIGSMSVSGNTSIDNFQVGFINGAVPGTTATASFTAGAGSTVRIGDGTGFLTIARMVNTPGSDAQEIQATLNLSQAAATTIDVATLRMATSNFRGRPRATLLLGGTTTLNANTFMMADAEAGDTPGGRSAMLSLGQDNDFHIDTWTIGGRKSNASVSFDPLLLNPTLNLSGNTNAATNLIIGDNNTGTGAVETSSLNLSGGTFNATLDTLLVGRFGTSGGAAIASLTMGAGTVTANHVILAQTSGTSPNNTTGTLTLNGGTLTVANAIVEGANGLTPGGGGTSTVTINAGTATVGTGLDVDNVRVGQNGNTGSLTVSSGPVRIGSGTSHNFEVGRKTTGGTTLGTANFSGASSVAINVNALNIGVQSTGGSGNTTGIVSLSASGPNSITASSILIGDSPDPTNSGTPSQLNIGSGTTTIFANSMTIAGRKSDANLTAGAGAVVTLAASNGTGPMDLRIARNNIATVAQNTGTFDLSLASSLNATLSNFHIGVKGDTSNGASRGIARLAYDSNITATNVIVGQSGNDGFTAASQQSQLFLGGGTTNLTTPSLLAGDRKTTALITFSTPGGTFNLGDAANRAEITLGRKSVDTGVNPTGIMDLRAGTAHLFATNINLGQETNLSGAGTPAGILILGDGSLNLSGNLAENHIPGGAGTSTLTVLGGQTFSIAGFAAPDTFNIGLDGVGGSVTYSGPSAQIGTPDTRTNLLVGRRNSNTSSTAQGTLDLSALTTFTAHLDQFQIATTNPSGTGSGQGQPRGIVTLAQNNTIDAALIQIADSINVGLGGFNNELRLGQSNTISADTLIIGGDKGVATVSFQAPSSTLDLVGRPTSAVPGLVNVFVGEQEVGTGGGAVSTLNPSGGTTNASINQIVIGSKPNNATGTTSGTVIIAAGAFNANTMVLARRTDAGTAGTVNGSFTMDGGDVVIGTVQHGGGNNANFLFNSGTLAFDSFGTSARPMHLNNTGTGILSPGVNTSSPMVTAQTFGTAELHGNYTQGPNATYQVDLALNPSHDSLTVHGNVLLDGLLSILTHGTYTGTLSPFTIISNPSGTTSGTFSGLAEGALIGALDFGGQLFPYYITYQGGSSGHDVVLFAPEPSRALFLFLAAAALLTRRTRRI
jgi:hypothetical protein